MNPYRWPWSARSLATRLCLIIALFLLLGTPLLAAGSGAAARAEAAAQNPVARMLLFYSETCSHCQVVLTEILPPLKAKYGAQLDYTLIEITNKSNLQLLVTLEKAYGVPADKATIPEIFIGRDVFLGEDPIRADLDKVIAGYLKQGGAGYTAPMQQVVAALQQPGPVVVQAVLFHMTTCSHCHEIITSALPVLKQRYGDQLQIKMVDVTSDEAYDKFSAYMVEKTGSEELVGVPTLIISDTLMLGTDDIYQKVENTINGYLAKNGTRYPELPAGLDGPEYVAPTPGAPSASPTVVATPVPTRVVDAKTAVNMAYFFQPGCNECDRVNIALNFLKNRNPQLVVTSFDVKEYAALNEWMGEQAGVPENKRLTAPAIFVGQDALVGENITLDGLEAIVQKYQPTGAPKVWEGFTGQQTSGAIVNRFRSLGVFTVLGAGLIDGLNPCAFATLIFFISYLTLSGRKGREVLLVGLAFAVGVFLAYLAVGLGLSRVLGSFDILTQIGRWVYLVTAVICLVLAGLSLTDYLKARRGQSEDMSLSLPKVLRRRINTVIREGQGARAFVPVAFVTGAVVSLIELACTGQVYLPTIIFVLSVPELRVRAFSYLVLYNLFFVAPLVVVFLLAYYGTTAAQLTKFLRNHAATIKLLTSALFLVLAGWLLYSVL